MGSSSLASWGIAWERMRPPTPLLKVYVDGESPRCPPQRGRWSTSTPPLRWVPLHLPDPGGAPQVGLESQLGPPLADSVVHLIVRRSVQIQVPICIQFSSPPGPADGSVFGVGADGGGLDLHAGEALLLHLRDEVDVYALRKDIIREASWFTMRRAGSTARTVLRATARISAPSNSS